MLNGIFFFNFLISSIFSQILFAADILPVSIEKVETTGLARSKINGSYYKKVSSVFEYKYESIKVENSDGSKDSLILNLESDVISFAIVIFTEKKNYGYVYELTNPLGEKIIAPNPRGVNKSLLDRPEINGRGQMLSMNAVMPEVYKEISITPVPINDKVLIQPGRWKFSIAAEEINLNQDEFFRVSVFVKKSNPIHIKTVGQVSIQTFATLESKTPQNKMQMQTYLKKALPLNNIGIHVAVQKHTVLESHFNSMCDASSRDCYKDLAHFRVEKSKRQIGVLDVYFVKRNNFSNSGIANIDGAVSSLFSDTHDMFDGVFIFTEPDQIDSPEKTKGIFMHELGHQLGLYHTDQDSISDTQSEEHWLEGNQKPQGINMMRPRDSHLGTATFSEGQKYVLLRSLGVDLYEPEQKQLSLLPFHDR
jgi:predicted Zn-dependent protease